MKNLKEYILTENNFFKNLGIGRKVQTEKWLQEHNELFNKRHHDITIADDGSLVITIKEIASLSYRHLEVPEYVTVSKIIFEKNSYNYFSLKNVVFEDFRGFIENVEIEFSNSSGREHKSFSIENCNITVDDIKYIPSSFRCLTFKDCPNIKGNIDITRESDDFKTDIYIENCKVNKINLNSKSDVITLVIDGVSIDSVDDINVKNGELRFLYLKESPLAKIIIKELETLAKADFDDISSKSIGKVKFNRIISKSKTLMEIINKFSEILLIQLSTKKIDAFIEYNPKKGKHYINEIRTK